MVKVIYSHIYKFSTTFAGGGLQLNGGYGFGYGSGQGGIGRGVHMGRGRGVPAGDFGLGATPCDSHTPSEGRTGIVVEIG